jgi:hypothetical protein
MTRPQPRRPPLDQCRPPLSQRCVQLLRHMLLFPEQLSAQCCLQTAASKANAGTDQTTRPSTATAETSLHIVASLRGCPGTLLGCPLRLFLPQKRASPNAKNGQSTSEGAERRSSGSLSMSVRSTNESGRQLRRPTAHIAGHDRGRFAQFCPFGSRCAPCWRARRILPRPPQAASSRTARHSYGRRFIHGGISSCRLAQPMNAFVVSD